MAVSGSSDFTVTAIDIIKGALRCIGVIAVGETPSAEIITDSMQSLNMMCKSWQANKIGLWLNDNVTVFTQKAAQSYLLGPSGGHATESYVETTLSADAAATAGTVDVSSITGISSGDYIGIELSTGYLQWTTVNGAPAGSTVTLTDALTSSASSGAVVYAYTTKMNRPVEIGDIRIDVNNGSEIAVDQVSRSEYMDIPTKDTTGKLNQVYYDPKLTNGVFYVWPTTDTVKDKILLTSLRTVYDFDATSNNPDFPQEWFETLKYNLAVRLAPEFGIPLDSVSDVVALATSTLAAVSNFDHEDTSIYFQPQTR